MDSATARERLQRLLDDIDRSTRQLQHEDAGASAELSTYDQHPADVASELSDMEREDAVLHLAAGQRAEVVAALARIDAGTYGRCTRCGRPIPEERLEARPEARYCLDDQRAVEAEHGATPGGVRS